MTLLGFVELKTPYQEDLKQAVKTCQEARVNVTRILNHDKNTATFMGINSGVLSHSDDISKTVVEASKIQNILENDESHRRSVNDIQLHLIVNIVGVAVNFIAAIPFGNTQLSAVQLLWVGLVTDTLSAFALAASDPPPGETIPLASALLLSKAVWRNVLVQVVYQTGILLMLHFKGKTILHVDDDGQATIDVIVFNTYVMFQVFGPLNASQIERRRGRWGEIFSWKNFSGKIYRNRWFVGVVGATVVLHSAAMETAMALICHNNNKKIRLLDSRQWLFCTGVAALSWPIGNVAKSIPVS
ncbi:Calcium-transporting ATPase 12, plasma membrane-type [Camellia lanceoleosa]|uniref:Calcium-transporting ATPase 12, plasma membrane-type n=1 Tax=Camellia lanceoleosa TaxID=1840588 RepID=A0ACC0HI57_9ERIC|nr:Calcium-transporting ATPase 12, plasma membrane-type [Camellia lanceoleosa]